MSSGISSIVSRILGGYCKIINKGTNDEEKKVEIRDFGDRHDEAI